MSRLSKRILAYAVQNKASLARVTSELDASYFSDATEKDLFTIQQGYFAKYSSMLTKKTLRDNVENVSVIEAEQQVLCEKLFKELQTTKIDIEDFERDMELFREEFIRDSFQRVVDGGQDDEGNFTPGILDMGEANPRQAYDTMISKLGPLMSDSDNKGLAERCTVSEGMQNILSEYKEVKEDNTKAYGIKTGYTLIDEATRGIDGGEMLVIGGRPGQGKSIFLLNIAVNAFREGKNVMIISIEMPLKQYLQRFASCYSNVSMDGLLKGTLSSVEEAQLKETWDCVKTKSSRQENLHIISIPVATAATIEAELNRLDQAIKEGKMKKPDLLIVDYLGIMRTIDKSPGLADWQDQGKICEELRLLGRRLSLPIVTAIQLNRDKQKTKGTARIARSDIIAATVDMFLQIEEEDDDPDALPVDDVMKVYVGKNRKGITDESFSLWKNFGNMLIRNRDAGKRIDPLDSFENLEQEIAEATNQDSEPEESPDMEV